MSATVANDAVRSLGLIADVHDHVWNLARALPSLAEHTDALLVLGDLVSPFVLARLGAAYPAPIHVVFGNNDGDRHRLVATAGRLTQVTIHGEVLRATFGGRRVVAQHFPGVAEVVDPSAADLIAFGHDHVARASRRGDAWLVNPGTLMGYDPAGPRDVSASWAVYDTLAHEVVFWRLDGPPAGEAVRWDDPSRS